MKASPWNGQLGVFKSETGKDPIMSFVGLRAKMYSFVTESDHKEHMKAKGVSKEALSHLHHEDYVVTSKRSSLKHSPLCNLAWVCQEVLRT